MRRGLSHLSWPDLRSRRGVYALALTAALFIVILIPVAIAQLAAGSRRRRSRYRPRFVR